MSNEIKTLAVEFDAAIAAGDRPRAGAILKRIRDALSGLSQEQVLAGIALFRKLIEVFVGGSAPEAQALAGNFTTAELVTYGVVDSENEAEALLAPGAWLQLITLLMQFIRQARSA